MEALQGLDMNGVYKDDLSRWIEPWNVHSWTQTQHLQPKSHSKVGWRHKEPYARSTSFAQPVNSNPHKDGNSRASMPSSISRSTFKPWICSHSLKMKQQPETFPSQWLHPRAPMPAHSLSLFSFQPATIPTIMTITAKAVTSHPSLSPSPPQTTEWFTCLSHSNIQPLKHVIVIATDIMW